MLICIYIFFAEVIKGNGKQIPQVVKLWVEQYEKDPKPAMVDLLTMLFEVTLVLQRLGSQFYIIQYYLSNKKNKLEVFKNS